MNAGRWIWEGFKDLFIYIEALLINYDEAHSEERENDD